MKSSNLKFILTLLSIVSLFCIYLPLPETVSAQKIGSESKPKSSNVIPTSPPACTPTTNNFSNTTPVPILDNTAVTSTINVTGAGTYLWDVDLQTFITHTFNADLDFTIQSPAGTIVTVSTDNGGSFDDVYNGTLFDDDANPLGQVPYTNNNGMVTDNLYVDLTTATPLTPEEPLAAFLGEDPNGIWTLTIYDDAGGDTGSLNSWNLNITTAACTTAAGVSVFGKVVTRSGRGIYGATVSLTDLQGTTRISRTNPFGYFSFEDIGVGQTYIVTTRSRNYDFNQFTMNIDDNVTNLVITAEN